MTEKSNEVNDGPDFDRVGTDYGQAYDRTGEQYPNTTWKYTNTYMANVAEIEVDTKRVTLESRQLTGKLSQQYRRYGTDQKAHTLTKFDTQISASQQQFWQVSSVRTTLLCNESASATQPHGTVVIPKYQRSLRKMPDVGIHTRPSGEAEGR
eukprot:15988562-Heterocapsa_arctica.AAC.1